MSWKDNYTRDLIITCGDGETFTCYTLPSFGKEIEFAMTEFNFIDVDHPLIKKTIIQGTDVPLEFFFINDDHIDQTNSFLTSASNPLPWTVTHPYYETILVQVSKIKIDDTDGNITKLSCNARVTIPYGEVTANIYTVDVIILKQVQVNAQLVQEPDLTPTITDINAAKSVTKKNYKNSVKIITNPIDSVDYFNAFNTASSYLNTITATPLAAINALTAIISLPAQFLASVQNRVRVLLDALANLHDTVYGLSTVSQKQLFFIQSTSTLAATAAAAAQPATGDYTNATVAVTIASQIKHAWLVFKQDIDTLQGANGGNPLSWFPTFNVMVTLGDLVNLTVSSLFDIALAGRKEFSYVLPEDSDYILLTHKFYGLDANDNNISEFINNNGLTYRQLPLGIKKGTTVVYYA